MKSDISALKSGMSNYTLIPDFREVKDLSEENKTNLRKLREEFEDWQSAQTENSEIVNIKRNRVTKKTLFICLGLCQA